MLLNDIDEKTAKVLARNWTTKLVISFYIQIDNTAFYENYKISVYCYDAMWYFIGRELAVYFDENIKL